MKILLFLIMAIYGGATISAGIMKSIQDKKCDLWTGLLIIGASAMMYGGFIYKSLIIAVFGLLTMHLGAAGVGRKMHGKMNLVHQSIRGIISMTIVIFLFLLI